VGSAGKTSAELPCRRCAGALGRSCCQPGPGERLATLTATDVERIRGATGLRRERFVDEEPFGPEEIRAYQASDSAGTWQLWISGQRIQVRTWVLLWEAVRA